MKTHFLIAFRNIAKNRVNSLITIFGLSVAIACLLLIWLYVAQEYSYNSFHEHKDRIFRVNYALRSADGENSKDVLLDPKLSQILKDKVPQIKRSAAYRIAHGPTLIFANKNFEQDVSIVGQDFFEMFSFELLIGNKTTLFNHPDEIVITAALAEKFRAVLSCAPEELIGKPVFFMNTGDVPFSIAGIIENPPKNSTIQFDALISYEYENTFPQSNNAFGNSTIFIETDRPGNNEAIEKEVVSALNSYYEGLLETLTSERRILSASDGFMPYIVSLKDVYIEGITYDYERSASKTNLHILSAIGILILIIACSNFILLSLGMSVKKQREVGVRKTFGANNGQIFGLFFIENLVVTVIAFGFGILLLIAFLPVFNDLAQNEIYLELIDVKSATGFLLGCALLIALSISASPVAKLVKLHTQSSTIKVQETRKSSLIGGFITSQYCLSIILIILAFCVVRQTNYMKNKSLGFSSDHIINMRIYHLFPRERIRLRDKLAAEPGIVDLTMTDRNYVSGSSTEGFRNRRGEIISARLLKVDAHYIPTLGLELVQGENFTEENVQDGDRSIIINEKLLNQLELQGTAIGQKIPFAGGNFTIIGVVRDFHFDSMKEEIAPLALYAFTDIGNSYNFMFIRYDPAQLHDVMPTIENAWNEIAPDKTLDIRFWDEQLEERYQSEERWSGIIAYAAIIAVTLSSLGLLGLTIMALNRKVKEIGIRKVNGARVIEMVTMLNKDFVKWVAIAFLIASPIAWYVMNKWLENFAYKTELSWWIFALAGFLALGIALLTVSWQSWKAATRNPVEALRYE